MYNVFSNKKTVLCTLLLTVAECGKEKRFLTGSSYLSTPTAAISLCDIPSLHAQSHPLGSLALITRKNPTEAGFFLICKSTTVC